MTHHPRTENPRSAPAPFRHGGSKVSVVICAKNEENTIADAVRGAARHADEVVVIDGRSTDATTARARDAGAAVYEDNGRGKGAAIRQAVQLVGGDIVVFMDSDGAHDPADIPRLIGPVVEAVADLSIGSRFAGGSDELSLNFAQLIRTIGNILMTITINRRWRVSLTDTLNGFRAIRRVVLLTLPLVENRHTIEQEMVMQTLRHGCRVVNVPSHEYPRRFGRSHINIWREWPLFLYCLIRNIARRDIGPGVTLPAALEGGGVVAESGQRKASRLGTGPSG